MNLKELMLAVVFSLALSRPVADRVGALLAFIGTSFRGLVVQEKIK